MEPIVDRLLSSREPSVRWKVRVHVLGESPTSRAVRTLQREIRDSPRARRLLSGRDAAGRLGPVGNVYDKWSGALWVMASLADLGYPAGDRSLLPVRDQVLDHWLAPHYRAEFEATTKAASYREKAVPVIRGRHRRCASQHSNALASVVVLGLADSRADDLVALLLHWQWPDGGWNCDRNPTADTSSFMETLIPLRALALVARETGTRKAGRAAKRAAEVFLSRHLFRRRSDGAVIRREFAELHYPLYWHYDILGGLMAMAEVGLVGDPRCSEALDLLESKRLPDGGWPAEARYYRGSKGRSGPVERVDWGGAARRRTNEWVTANALFVLREAGRIEA